MQTLSSSPSTSGRGYDVLHKNSSTSSQIVRFDRGSQSFDRRGQILALEGRRTHLVNSRRGGQSLVKARAAGEESPSLQQPGTYKAPLFKPFISKTYIVDQLKDFELRQAAPGGELVVRILAPDHIPGTSTLLTDAFSDAMGYLPMYRRYLQMHIEQYLMKHIDLLPKTVILVAVLQGSSPAATDDGSSPCTLQNHASSGVEANGQVPDTSGQPGGTRPERGGEAGWQLGDGWSRQGGEASGQLPGDVPVSGGLSAHGTPPETLQDGTLVGTVELSFSTATRTRFLTLNAPAECAYLCNMAVAEPYQRRGYGRILLDACERVTRLLGEKDIYLHLRLKDRPAAGLYKRGGFSVAETDSPLMFLLGQDRRYLMRKAV